MPLSCYAFWASWAVTVQGAFSFLDGRPNGSRFDPRIEFDYTVFHVPTHLEIDGTRAALAHLRKVNVSAAEMFGCFMCGKNALH